MLSTRNMIRATDKPSATATERELLRLELLRLIIKNEAQRRQQPTVAGK